MPPKESFLNSCTVVSSAILESSCPLRRAEANKRQFPTGKLRFSSVLIISMPTAPVAPTTATCGLRISYSGARYTDRPPTMSTHGAHSCAPAVARR